MSHSLHRRQLLALGGKHVDAGRMKGGHATHTLFILVVAPALDRSQLQEPFAVVRSREAVGDRLVEAALLHDLLVASI